MSSFPRHEENIKKLAKLGFDVDEALEENGEVSYDSWGYDELVYLMTSIIKELESKNLKS